MLGDIVTPDSPKIFASSSPEILAGDTITPVFVKIPAWLVDACPARTLGDRDNRLTEDIRILAREDTYATVTVVSLKTFRSAPVRLTGSLAPDLS
jgi:hypothetical protein